MSKITARLFTDPSCPWGYSASPALRRIEWRYRDQIDWQLVTIGLSDPVDSPPKFSPADFAQVWLRLRNRFGMPFAVEAKSRQATSSTACRAIVATRMLQPGFEWRVLRTLQLLQFNTPLLLDDESQLRAALSSVGGLALDPVMAALDSAEVRIAFERDRTEARSPEVGAASLQNKTVRANGVERHSAPSIIFSRDGRSIEAGGFQPVQAYDVIVANLGPDLNRAAPAEGPLEALALYPGGLTTQEVAAVTSDCNDVPDRAGTEGRLVALLADGRVRRIPMGDDAVWLAGR
jgi:protein-disulfide isomerase-like protein with CxxC motif